jgi:4-amino-4-deoxy-L-arabinose transferase-like glycosyltransferase
LSTRHQLLVVGLLIGVAVVRVISTYNSTSQAFDEPCHVAAAIELLDRHTYTLDPVHPPLSRIAIGVPLYLAGERYPDLTADEAAHPNYNMVGNHILYDHGHYTRNLALARSAMLPFLVFASVLVFLWARREFGNLAAILSVLLFTTTPIVLAFSSLAYSDLVTATTQLFALFAFTIWLKTPSVRSTVILGIAIGLVLMSKLTSFLFLPVAGLAILLPGFLGWASTAPTLKRHFRQFLASLVIAVLTLWSGYGFAVGHVREEMNFSPEAMPSFQHFPNPVAKLGKAIVLKDPIIPGGELLRGLATGWALNQTSPQGYLFGDIRPGGWWYFFLAGVMFKTPLPFLILCGLGMLSVGAHIRARRLYSLTPAIFAIAIFIVTMPVKYNAGVRHVLVVFPLLALFAGQGCAYFWRSEGKVRAWSRSGLVILLLWQGIESFRAQGDLISYFNELAGHDPSRIMVTGCDLDCGQDVFRLLRSSQLERFHM